MTLVPVDLVVTIFSPLLLLFTVYHLYDLLTVNGPHFFIFICHWRQHQIFSLVTLLSCQLPKCLPNTSPSLRSLSTALLSLLEYLHPRLPTLYTHRYTKTIPLIPIKISSKKHPVNGLGVIQYLHLIQIHVLINQHPRRLWGRRFCCLPRFCFGWLLIWGKLCGWSQGWGWVGVLWKR